MQITPPLITELNQKVGILFEEISEVRTFQLEWEVITYVNLTKFRNDQESFKQTLQKLINCCEEIYKLNGKRFEVLQKCGNLIDGFRLIVLEMEDFSQEYFSNERKVTKKKRETFDQVKNMQYFNRKTINTNKEEIYYENLVILEDKGKYRMMDPVTRTTYIQSIINIQTNELHTISYHIVQLNLLIKSLNDFVEDAKLHYYDISNQIFINKLHDIFTFTNTLIANIQYKMRQIFELLPSKHNGNNSPDIIPPLIFLVELHNITNSIYHSGLELPFELIEENLASFYEISHVQTTIVEEQLIIRIAIPLIHVTPLRLYKANPFPFPLENDIFAFIYPENDYFMMDYNNHRYYPVTEDQINKCQNKQGIYICKLTTPTIYTRESDTCIINIFKNSTDLSSCEIRLIEIKNDLWIELYKPNSWIYLVSHTRVVLSKCYGKETETIRLNTAGILSLQENCCMEANGLVLYTKSTIDIPEVAHFVPVLHFKNQIISLLIAKSVKQFQTYYVPPFNIKYMNKNNIHQLLHYSVAMNQLNEPMNKHLMKTMMVQTTNFFPVIIFSAIVLITYIAIRLKHKYINTDTPQENVTRSRPISADITFL